MRFGFDGKIVSPLFDFVRLQKSRKARSQRHFSDIFATLFLTVSEKSDVSLTKSDPSKKSLTKSDCFQKRLTFTIAKSVLCQKMLTTAEICQESLTSDFSDTVRKRVREMSAFSDGNKNGTKSF